MKTEDNEPTIVLVLLIMAGLSFCGWIAMMCEKSGAEGLVPGVAYGAASAVTLWWMAEVIRLLARK